MQLAVAAAGFPALRSRRAGILVPLVCRKLAVVSLIHV